MYKITVGWMYPDLLNLHGERGSLQGLIAIGANLGLDVEVRRIENFDEPIPFDELDILMFLPGEITTFKYLVPAMQRQMEELKAYVEKGGYILGIGTSGMMFGKEVKREDGTVQEGLGLLDMTATERHLVWGDDLILRVKDTRHEMIGCQNMMADVQTTQPFGKVIYGYGNNGGTDEGARYKNVIYTNCIGPVLVKNPWFTEDILKDICLNKFLGLQKKKPYKLACDSFDSAEEFVLSKKK